MKGFDNLSSQQRLLLIVSLVVAVAASTLTFITLRKERSGGEQEYNPYLTITESMTAEERQLINQVNNIAELRLGLTFYRNTNGVYPERLEDLLLGTMGNGLKYTKLPEIPVDAFTARPLPYQRTSDDNYTIRYVIRFPAQRSNDPQAESYISIAQREFADGENVATADSRSSGSQVTPPTQTP